MDEATKGALLNRLVELRARRRLENIYDANAAKDVAAGKSHIIAVAQAAFPGADQSDQESLGQVVAALANVK